VAQYGVAGCGLKDEGNGVAQARLQQSLLGACCHLLQRWPPPTSPLLFITHEKQVWDCQLTRGGGQLVHLLANSCLRLRLDQLQQIHDYLAAANHDATAICASFHGKLLERLEG
jgi:hypothetical protein